MKNTTQKFATVLVAVVLVAGLGFTDAGRKMATSLLDGASASAAGSGRYQLSVLLSTTDGRSYEFTAPLDDSAARDLRNNPGSARDKFVLQAKKAMAEKLGYSESKYGADSYKMLSSPKLTAFRVTDSSSGRTEDLFRDERRQANFDDLHAE